MKVLQINYNYNKNIQFCGRQCLPTANWIALRDALSQPYRYTLNEDVILKTGYLPAFDKVHFEYFDYKNLSPKEKLIIDILNKKGNDDHDYSTARGDISIKKDASRILDVASDIKKYLEGQYKNGFKLVGIGRSPAAIVETMQLLGADAITLPFSKQQIEYCNSREFPYEHFVPSSTSYYEHFEKCSTKDWEDYFKYYGVYKDFTKNTGKTLIFTDYVCNGWTKKYIESILKGIGFDKNYEFTETYHLLPSDTESKRDYLLSNCFDYSVFKCYAKMESPKIHIRNVDIIKHPEYIPSLPETFISKLFRCALYDLLTKK
ncbi:hypothetical protein J6S88_08055 [bacterium]|nr:hypothetical protein [bacterium]